MSSDNNNDSDNGLGSDQPANYDVGYGKPPKHTRFQAGQSGNKNGRKKGSKGLRTDLAEEMAELVTITENGKKLRVTKQRLVIKSLVKLASQGNVTAADKLMGYMVNALGFEDRRRSKSKLNSVDAAILASLLGDAIDDGNEPAGPINSGGAADV